MLILSFFLSPFLLVVAQEPQLVLPIGHTGKINDAEFSPDGKLVVTASEDGSAKLWGVENGYLLHELKGHALWLDMAKFSPACKSDPTGGKYILTASNDNTAKIWLTKSGKLLSTLKGATGMKQLGNGGIWINAGFSPDSKYVVTASDAQFDNGKLQIWETATGRIVRIVKTSPDIRSAPVFSPDSKSIMVITGAKTTAWCDIVSGNLTPLKKGDQPVIDSVVFSPDRKYFLTIERNENSSTISTTVYIKDAQSRKTVLVLPDTLSYTNIARFSPDGKMIVTGNDDNLANIWRLPSGKSIQTLTGHTSHIDESLFSRDGKFILSYANSEDSIPIAWDLSTGKPIKKFNGDVYDISSTFNRWVGDGDSIATYWNDSLPKTTRRKGALAAAFFNVAEISPNGKYVVTAEGTWDNDVRLWDAAAGRLLTTLKGHTGVVSSAHFSYDGRMIITAAFDDSARVWDTKTGKLLFKLDGHQAGVKKAQFSPDANYIITTCRDNSMNLWDAKTRKLVYTFFIVDSTDYLGKIPTGYYQSSTGAAKLLHYVTRDLQVISFEQLDVKYNRPDKVLEAIGNKDTTLIKSYRKAYEKRIKRLGIDTSSFKDGYGVPQSGFENREMIEADPERKTKELTLHIKGTDSSYQLDRFNVWVNEVPVYGQRGFSIRKRSSNSFDTTIRIGLSQGENRIETSVFNENGTESYRMPLIVNYSPPTPQKVMTRFIGIGIDHFADAQYDLRYSAKDIRDLSLKLKEKYGDAIIIDTLFNEKVTVSNIKALKQKLMQTTDNDKVIIAYSGHGMLSRDYDYYLSTYAVNFEQPEQNGLSYDDLENLLDSIPARKKLMLIDACHSGEVDKDELVTIGQTIDSMKLKRGLKPVRYRDDEKHLGLKNSFELMQSVFVNVGKSTGATIISAAAGTQFALERNDLENGVFTYSILEAMKNYPSLKISELKRIVGERVEQLTNGLQKPTSRNETIAVDWEVW